MANIVTVAVPAFIEESSEYDTQYKRTMKWNPEKGVFRVEMQQTRLWSVPEKRAT